jgi:glycerol-3-phosphate acyltransferase PlsY
MTWMHQIFGQPVQASHVTSIFLGAYLLGCFTTGYYLVRISLGRDIREMESGSVGARNVGRVLGMPGFTATLVADFSKGALAVWLTRHYTQDDRLAALAMLAVVMGHIWPIQLGLRGGKGVATSLGALAAYHFYFALVFAALFAGLLLILRRTTLAGLIAFVLLPLAVMYLEPEPWHAIALSILAGMILLAHRKNLLDEFTLLAARRHADTKPDQPIK